MEKVDLSQYQAVTHAHGTLCMQSNPVFEAESLLRCVPSHLLLSRHLLTMMEEKQLLYSKFLVHALSSAHETVLVEDNGHWEP